AFEHVYERLRLARGKDRRHNRRANDGRPRHALSRFRAGDAPLLATTVWLSTGDALFPALGLRTRFTAATGKAGPARVEKSPGGNTDERLSRQGSGTDTTSADDATPSRCPPHDGLCGCRSEPGDLYRGSPSATSEAQNDHGLRRHRHSGM